MTRDEFIQNVIQELTHSMSVAGSPKEERIDFIIDRVKRKFYENDDRCNVTEYIIMKAELFSTPLFKAKRAVKMPDCVIAITDLRTIGSNYFGNNINRDYLKTNFNYVNALTGNPNDMLTAVVNGFYISHLQSFILKTVSFDATGIQFSHMLTITGRNPVQDLVATASVTIHEEALFEMADFFDYVVGECKKSFAKIYGFTNTKLIGGVDLNLVEMKDEGKELIDKVEAYWKEMQNNVAFFINEN